MEPRTVLLIDDDLALRMIADKALTSLAGWEVRTAAGGADGVAIAAAWQPDVVLLDLVMPDLDGRQTLVRLRAADATASLTVVMLTGSPDDVDAEELGIAGVIAKPFDPLTLHEQVRRVLADD